MDSNEDLSLKSPFQALPGNRVIGSECYENMVQTRFVETIEVSRIS
jgi:hypothetical protein